MPKRDLKICNELGLHARAASKLVDCAGRFQSEVNVSHGERTVNAKSIMGVLMLAAAFGTTITLETSGADEDLALEELTGLVNSGFGENNE